MKKVLIIQSRPEEETSNDEFRAFLTYGGLTEYEVVRLRGERDGIPELSLDDYSAIIMGGGPFNITDPEEKKSDEQKRFESEVRTLLLDVVERDMPFFGACYAMGPIVSCQSGTVSTKFGEDVAVVDITLTEEGARDSLTGALPETFGAIVGHHEACETPPADAVVLASSEACPVQMLRFGSNVYVSQFHPELDEAGIRTRLEAYAQHGYGFDEQTKGALITRLLSRDFTTSNVLLRRFVRKYHRGEAI